MRHCKPKPRRSCSNPSKSRHPSSFEAEGASSQAELWAGGYFLLTFLAAPEPQRHKKRARGTVKRRLSMEASAPTEALAIGYLPWRVELLRASAC